MKLGTVLRTRRMELGLTQHVLADKLDISEDHVGLVERNQRTPSVQLLERWSNELDLPLVSLLFEAEPVDDKLSEKSREIITEGRRVAKLLLELVDELEKRTTSDAPQKS